jgi:hypothetical protein
VVAGGSGSRSSGSGNRGCQRAGIAALWAPRRDHDEDGSAGVVYRGLGFVAVLMVRARQIRTEYYIPWQTTFNGRKNQGQATKESGTSDERLGNKRRNSPPFAKVPIRDGQACSANACSALRCSANDRQETVGVSISGFEVRCGAVRCGFHNVGMQGIPSSVNCYQNP